LLNKFHLFNLNWFYTAISWVMARWHDVFSTFLDPAGGITWALSIVFLVVTVRIVLFRFFIKQVKSQRAMQEIQPEIQKLKKQFGSDRQGFSQAVMALQKERGVNPLAGCLPVIPQIPVFISLLHVLRRLTPHSIGLYSWSTKLTHQAATALFFGAPISSSFKMQPPKEGQVLAIPGVTYLNIRIVCVVLIVVMCITTFYTQKQIQRRSGPVEGQAAMVQKLMLYGMPVGLFVSGFFFPLGVLLYWFTNNLWTLGQQFYILKKLPVPGAKAAADRPAVDPKTLAPRPGAKPVRNRPGRPAVPPPADQPAAESEPVDLQKGSDAKKADQQKADQQKADQQKADQQKADQQKAAGNGKSPGAGGSPASEPARPLNGQPVAGAGSNGTPRPAGRPGRAGQGPGNRSKRKRR
jgi:YidC/Oxa1 family membrane protein insertase